MRIFKLLALALPLSGCCFTPLMKGGSCPQKVELHVSGEGYVAYKFRREMEKQLALLPEITPEKVILRVVMADAHTGSVTAPDANASRMMSTITGSYTLSSKSQSIGGGSISSISSYAVNASDEFISRVAQKAAIDRTSTIVAEDTVREIAMKLRRSQQ